MIFDNPNLAVRVLNTVHYADENVHVHMKERSFCALSFRLCTGTQILSRNKRYTFQKGDIAFFPMRTSYSRFCEKEELIAVHFELFNDDTKEISVYTPKNKELFEKLFLEILEIDQKREIGYTYAANAKLNEIFEQIHQERGEAEPENAVYAEALRQMQEQYANPQFSIKSLSENLKISERHLRNVFRKVAHVSPKEMLTRIRMHRAASLLNSGLCTVAKVAEQVGFYDAKYFAVAYKKFTSVSPRDYRANKGEVDRIFRKEQKL